MITKDGKLLVFEGFRVDHNLPKHNKQTSENVNDSFPVERTPSTINFLPAVGWQIEEVPTKIPWYKRLFSIKREPKRMSIEEFFASVKNSAQELVIVKERAAGYEKALDAAKKSNQTALCEKLIANLSAVKMEAQLIALGLTKYIEEKDIAEFYKKSKKGIKLNWIANFTRIIPEEVLAKKGRADELGLFDNYVVMHYDPDAKSYAETQAEIAKRKDPILFGVMKDRRVLYFVGDWVDEFCDLTLDQIADMLGASAIKNIG